MPPLVPFVCRLPSRRIIRVRGIDAHDFLQGIFTNDLRELHPTGSMYGCFLYFTGRVLCDAHLYQCKRVHEGQASILVDVHQDSAEELTEHLREMKMRKKVAIESVGEDLTVVAALEHSAVDDSIASSSTSSGEGNENSSLRKETVPSLADQHTECFADARNAALFPPPRQPKVEMSDDGERIEPPSPVIATPPPWFLKRCVVPVAWSPPLTATDPYTTLLYTRGIGEGPTVFKNNKSLPFEGNLDFLKGVSFHKGCYVGQELTHRTHVMLVTRKRTVPLVFATEAQNPARAVEVGEPLFTAEKEKIGEVTGVCGGVGVGLLRLRYVDKESRSVPGLQLSDGMAVGMQLPDWWPRREVKKLLKNNS